VISLGSGLMPIVIHDSPAHTCDVVGSLLSIVAEALAITPGMRTTDGSTTIRVGPMGSHAIAPRAANRIVSPTIANLYCNRNMPLRLFSDFTT
jgi:hypothetical protein